MRDWPVDSVVLIAVGGFLILLLTIVLAFVSPWALLMWACFLLFFALMSSLGIWLVYREER